MFSSSIIFIFILSTWASGQEDWQRPEEMPNRRLSGYHGIWFTLGQFYAPGLDGNDYSAVSRSPVFPHGDKYSGGLATYTNKHSPLAIHCPKVERTFFVYGGTENVEQRHLLCMISYFDHQTGTVPKPVVVHDKQGVDDPHDNPSLCVDGDGFLWVFVSGRNRSRMGYKYRSRRPYDISCFDQVDSGEMTYPQPHFLGGEFVHLFTKYSGVRELYFETSRDGIEWSSDLKLAGIREAADRRAGHYQVSDSKRDGNGYVIGTFFNRHPNGDVDRRTDLYYVQTSDAGKTWRTIDGEMINIPITEVNSATRVFETSPQHRNIYLKNMVFDELGHPVLLFVSSGGAQPGPPNEPRWLQTVHWDGTQWLVNNIAAVDHNYDSGSLSISVDGWTALAPTDPGPQPGHSGGEIVKYRSVDHGVTWEKNWVTKNSGANHNYVRRVVGAKEPFAFFWADGDPIAFGESKLYFCDSSGRKVYQLPTRIEAEAVSPTRIEWDD